MSKKIYPLFIILILLNGCLSPKYYLWKDYKENNYESLPWSGPDEKPVRQYKEEVSIMSDIQRSQVRWKLSNFNKVPVSGKDSFLGDINRFLIKNNLLHRWRMQYNQYYIVSKGDQFYQFKMVSINPIIVIARPYRDAELLMPKKNSKYNNIIEYGTFIKFDKDLFYFSPDLDILPQPLDLSDDNAKKIYWSVPLDSGSLQFKKSRELVYVKRLDNKSGKDTKREGSYDPGYHLKLIPREEQMKKFMQ